MKSLLLQIENSLKSTIQLVLDLSKNKGYTAEFPKYQYTIKYYEPEKDNPTSYTGKTEEREHPSFNAIYKKIRNDVENSTQYKDLNSKCNAFKSKHAKYMEILGSINYGEIFIKEYFSKLSLLAFNDDIIKYVVSIFKNDLVNKKNKISLYYYIENFDAQSTIYLNDETVIRPIYDKDLSQFSVFNQFPINEQRYLSTNGWICHISFLGNKNSYEDINNADEKINLIMGALFLLKPGNSKFRLLMKTIDNPFLNWGFISGGRTVNSGIGNKIVLSQEDIILFKSFYKLIQRINNLKKYRQLQFALSQITHAVNSRHNTDKILNFVIALENLIASDTPALETTYRFKLRIATVMDHKYGNSRERMKIASELYDIRSKIVHGREKSDKVNEFIPIAEDILRQIIVWFIENMSKMEPHNMIALIDNWMVRDNIQVNKV